MVIPKRSSPVVSAEPLLVLDPNSQHPAQGWENRIEPDPNRPGPDRALLADTGIPVWAIVAHLQALTGAEVVGVVAPNALRQAAVDYAVDEDLIAAALAFYRAHRGDIDARLARNAAAVS